MTEPAASSGGGYRYSEPRTAERLDDAVLEAVLETTSRASELDFRPQTMEALQAVARRRFGQAPLSPEALQELVEVFVADIVQSLPAKLSAAWVKQRSAEIAGMLLDNEESLNRLKHFWTKLQSSVS